MKGKAGSSEDADSGLRDLDRLTEVLQQQRLSFEEAIALIDGESLEEARASVSLRSRQSKVAETLRDTRPESWSFQQVCWDIRKASQHFCLDGVKRREFALHYPQGFLLGWVSTEVLDCRLSKFSRRTDDELWSVGNPRKLAYLIAFLSDGRSVSPPLVKPVGNGTINLSGGNHRYALARALRQTPIPICAERAHQEALTELLAGVTWSEAPG